MATAKQTGIQTVFDGIDVAFDVTLDDWRGQRMTVRGLKIHIPPARADKIDAIDLAAAREKAIACANDRYGQAGATRERAMLVEQIKTLQAQVDRLDAERAVVADEGRL